MNQIDIPNYQYYLDCNAKKMVRLTFLEKSSYFSRKYRLIRLFYFQKYKVLLGQGVIQIEPNWVWSMPWVPRV